MYLAHSVDAKAKSKATQDWIYSCTSCQVGPCLLSFVQLAIVLHGEHMRTWTLGIIDSFTHQSLPYPLSG